MITQYLDKEIELLLCIKRNDVLSKQGEEQLKEYKEIKRRIKNQNK
jgi:hypothetical protein